MQIQSHAVPDSPVSSRGNEYPEHGAETRTTYEQYFSLPEGAPYQLIAGELVMTPSPVPLHQKIVMDLAFMLNSFVKKNNSGQVFVAPLDVRLDNNNVYQPDLLFISKDRAQIIGKTMIEGAPDLVIEVLSPATAYYDLRTKYRVYEQCGVAEYWIVDPERKSIEIFSNENGKFCLYCEAEATGTVQSDVVADFSVSLQSIFP